MKEIRTEVQKIEEIITYESVDGKKFDSKEKCERWEQSYKCTIRTAFKKIPQIKTSCEGVGLVGLAEDEVIILKPRDLNDIVVINAYGEMLNCLAEPLTQEDIGKVLMLYTGWEEDWFIVYYMDRYLEDMIKQYGKFKTELNDLQKEKENENCDYEFECNMTEEYFSLEEIDEWGMAYLWLDNGEKGVEYNFCLQPIGDEIVNCCAIYKIQMNPVEDVMETSYNEFVHYEIDPKDKNWKKNLEKAMLNVALNLWEKGE